MAIINIPTLEDIYNQILALFKAAYGVGLDTSPDSPDMQLIANISNLIYQQNQKMSAVYDASKYNQAQDFALKDLLSLLNIQSSLGTFSTLTAVSLGGVAGTVIPAGSKAKDAAGNLWHTVASKTLTGSGDTVGFICETIGSITCAPGSLSTIVTVITGWTSVNNGTAATPGTGPDNDYKLRQKHDNLSGQFSLGYIGAIRAAVFKINTINDVRVIENDSSDPLPAPLDIPAHSIDVVVDYLDESLDQQIGDAIFIAKGAPSTFATTDATQKSVTVIDIGGKPHTVEFNKATQVNLYLKVTVSELSLISYDIVTLIKNTLIAYVQQNCKIHGNLVYSKFLASIADLDPNINIEDFWVKNAPSPDDTNRSDILAGEVEIFILTAANIDVEISS